MSYQSSLPSRIENKIHLADQRSDVLDATAADHAGEDVGNFPDLLCQQDHQPKRQTAGSGDREPLGGKARLADIRSQGPDTQSHGQCYRTSERGTVGRKLL